MSKLISVKFDRKVTDDEKAQIIKYIQKLGWKDTGTKFYRMSSPTDNSDPRKDISSMFFSWDSEKEVVYPEHIDYTIQ